MKQLKGPVSLRRRVLVFSSVAGTLLPFAFATSDALAQAQIVDRSGSLRMLSQRITKAYAQLGLSVLPNDAETILARSLTRFNGALVALRENKASDQSIVKRIDSDWSEFRDLVSTPPNKAAFPKVDALSESLLSNAEALTAQLTAALGIQGAKLTNMAGRQRMLSQRMAKSAFALMWGMDQRAFAKQHDTAHQQFASALVELKRAAQTMPKITQTLELAETQFGFFDAALGNRSDLTKLSPPKAANVAKSNERLLEVFDEATAQFAGLQG